MGDGRPRLEIVICSTRSVRVGSSVADWFVPIAEAREDFDVGIADLRELDLPFLSEPTHPRLRRYEDERTKGWSVRVGDADAFVLVMPEYNHGFNAPLKNALDTVYLEWAYKPVGFVSYGSIAGGTRAVQMVKPVLLFLRMSPVLEAVHIPFVSTLLDDDRRLQATEAMGDAARLMLDELVRMEQALRELREEARSGLV
jgi:NAD(P)H-dependent FMN reductase